MRSAKWYDFFIIFFLYTFVLPLKISLAHGIIWGWGLTYFFLYPADSILISSCLFIIWWLIAERWEKNSRSLLNQKSPEDWKDSGNQFFKNGEYNEAIKCYFNAIQLDSNYIDAWNNLGFTYQKLGKFEEAKKCNEKVRELKQKY